MTSMSLTLVLLALAAPVLADDDDWTQLDSIAEASVQVALATDLVTSLSPRSIGCHESNPILGRNPSDLSVTVYVGAAMVGHYLIARLLPQPWRRIWQGLVFGVEVAAVGNNLSVGGGLRTQW